MLVEAYRASLKRWMWNVGIVAVLFLMVGLWYSVYQQRIEFLFLGAWIFGFLFVLTFAVVSVYHVVVAYLWSKETGRQ